MTLTKQRQPLDDNSAALSYDRLEEPWRQWAKIASSFIRQLDDHQDREDLMHDIIVRCYEIAEKYRREGRTLSKWGAIKVAEYTRLRFYDNKQRYRRMFVADLNRAIRNEDGSETEMIQTIADKEGVDQDTWLDAKTYFDNAPERTRQAFLKLLTDWKLVNGNDWRLIRRFREEYKALA